MTTPKKPTETAGNPGSYDYMRLLSEFDLVLRKFDWMDDAACRGIKNVNFFPDVHYNTEVHQAIAICRTCSVREDCAEFAIENQIEYGVWGGMTAAERKQWRRDTVIP